MKELSDKQEEIIVQKMQAELHLQDHAQRNEADQKRLQELKKQVGKKEQKASIKNFFSKKKTGRI